MKSYVNPAEAEKIGKAARFFPWPEAFRKCPLALRRARMALGLGAVIFAARVPAGRAEQPVVDWGGQEDYDGRHIELALPPALEGGDGKTDIYAFSDSNPLASEIPAVKVPEQKTVQFFGGSFLSSSTGSNRKWTWARVQALTPDSIRLAFDRQEHESEAYSGAVFVAFLKKDFLENAGKDPVSFDGTSKLEMNVTTDSKSPARFRFAVLNGGQWYLSEKAQSAIGTFTIGAEEIMFSKWGKWNPQGGEEGRLAPAPGEFVDADGGQFANIEGVGFFADFQTQSHERVLVATKVFRLEAAVQSGGGN